MSFKTTETADSLFASSIWGPLKADQASSERLEQLSNFFDHCARERLLLCLHQPQFPNSTARITSAISKLKSSATCPRISVEENSTDPQGAAIIECAVRLMLMTDCQTEGMTSGSCNQFRWTEEESLEAYVNRVYAPSSGVDSKQPANISDLRAKVLAKHAGIDIQPTDKLSDHLCLVLGPGFKILYVFSHRYFLEQSLEILSSDCRSLSQSTKEALVL